MNHLDDMDLIRFVTANELSAENLQLASKVNSHIAKCEECMTRLQAFQVIQDEFDRLSLEQAVAYAQKKLSTDADLKLSSDHSL